METLPKRFIYNMILNTSNLGKYSRRTVLVDGCFDPLHYGHIEYFKFAASFGLPVFCNIETDKYIERYKKRKALIPEEQRIHIIDAIKYITYTHLQSSTTTSVLSLLKPLKYIKGFDWKEKKLPQDEESICKKLKIDILYTEKNIDSSTTLLNKFIKSLQNFS